MFKEIPLSVPSFYGREWRYVKECLDTGWVSSAGKYVERFEANIGKLMKVKYAIACVNGTAALHIALRVVGVEPRDEVIVPTVTFISPVNAVRYLGAEPVFMDCDEFYNMDATKTTRFIKEKTVFKGGFTFNKMTKRLIRAIIPVHVFGNAADLEQIVPICRERNIKIIEDAAESIGVFYLQGKYKGKYTGTIGDIGCYSFNGNKIVTTGGGGMIITNHDAYAQKAQYLTTQAKDNEIYSIHDELGYNFRLSNLQAALGVAQLERLRQMIAAKENNYYLYKKSIDKIVGLHLAETPTYAQNNYWLYALLIDSEVYGLTRDQLLTAFAKENIQTRPVWYLNHLQKEYQNCYAYRIEKAYELFEKTLNIPSSVGLKKSDILRIVGLLKKYHEGRSLR